MPYDPHSIETRLQERWHDRGIASVSEDPDRKKFYCLEMFMYPSGKIHMGHVRNYTIGDVVARFWRMRGVNVLHPFGFDAFGLPAENAAIKGNTHPRVWTDANIQYMKTQLNRLGFLYDWNREVRTCDPDYYRWNQWFFLKMFEKGLAYRAERYVNWCPQCATVLANEQVEGGTCWRCGSAVTQREMAQWFLRITDYAQELLDDLDSLQEWPPEVVTMQRNWIGRSQGAYVNFPLAEGGSSIRVFTTRIDTIYGATYIVLAPEHDLVDAMTTDQQRGEVDAFRKKMLSQTAHERSMSREKEGVFTGAFALNPFSGEKIPVYLANFVLADYGTGAIMSVPAHDQRDFEFAASYDLPVRIVVRPPGWDGAPLQEAYSGDGVLQDSGPFTGKPNREAMPLMAAHAKKSHFGESAVTFRIKDWGISRQRYWGTPIPMIYCPKCGTVPVPEEALPVLLPANAPLTGKGESPLVSERSFVETTCPVCGGAARRETDTMDTFVDSSWYFFRYANPHETSFPIDREAVNYWTPVDFYIGGIEHATMHLIYCRFFTKVMRDLGLIDFGEPVKRLMCQGMVIKDGAKMSKSLGNVVDPDAMIERYGADAVRLNIVFLSPPTDQLDWKESGAEGAARFLNRVYTTVETWKDDLSGPAEVPVDGPAFALRRKTHQTIRKVTQELETRLKINTAVAALMELVNAQQDLLSRYGKSPQERYALKESLEALVSLLSPFAPHAADAMWEMMGHDGFLIDGPWPAFEADIAREDEVTLAVQVNGKLRAEITLPLDADKEAILAEAKANDKVRGYLENRKIVREIVVPGRIVNFVVKAP